MTNIDIFITNYQPFFEHVDRKYSRVYTTFKSELNVLCKTVYVFSLESERNVLYGNEILFPKNVEELKKSKFFSIVDFDVPEELKSKTIDSREYFAHHIKICGNEVTFNKKIISKSKPKPKPKKATPTKVKPKTKPKGNNKSEAKGNADKPVQK